MSQTKTMADHESILNLDGANNSSISSSEAKHSSKAIEMACNNDVKGLSLLSLEDLTKTDKQGSCTLHWAAGSNCMEVVKYLIEKRGISASLNEASRGDGKSNRGLSGRSPLHFAARNGHLEMVQYLCDLEYVDCDHRAKANVSPFQLAVWQNQFQVAQYLVLEQGVDAHQLNDFACGAQHWLGLCPKHRAGINGCDLIPFAKWLFFHCKVNFHLGQRQGHTPLHKAAWGGHLSLVQWICSNLEVVDDQPDQSGNYASDIAQMGQHHEIAQWLRHFASPARLNAARLLGVSYNISIEDPALRVAYLKKCKQTHPDRLLLSSSSSSSSSSSLSKAVHCENIIFEEVTAAYALLRDPAIADEKAQRNKRHSLPHLIAQHPNASLLTPEYEQNNIGGSGEEASSSLQRGKGEPKTTHEEGVSFFFKTRLVASILEYGVNGLPLAMLPKKFEQVWSEPLPSSESLGLRRNLSLLKMLKHFPDTVKLKRSVDGCIKVHVTSSDH